jgi:RHS repeat-associated protein
MADTFTGSVIDTAGQLATAVRVSGATTTTHTRSYAPDDRLAGITNKVGAGAIVARTFDWNVTGGSTAQLLSYTTTAGGTRDLSSGPNGWVSTRTGATPRAVSTDVYGSVYASTGVTDVARSTSYTAFGAPAATNTFDPKLGYRGELQLDSLLYLRARNYQLGISQFTSRDPMPGVPGTATLAAPYHYADNSPLQRVDPTGMYAIDDIALMPFPEPVPFWKEHAGTLVSLAAGIGCGILFAPTGPGAVAAAAACSAAAGALGRGTQAVVNGGDYNDALKAALNPKAILFDATAGVAGFGAGAAISKTLPKLTALTKSLRFGASTTDDGIRATTTVIEDTASATATKTATEAAGETTRVGRWMSPDEHAAMVRTGEVQVGAGGTTYVANPADVSAFTPNRLPSNYVEFDVPTSSLRPGQPEWGQIPSPDSVWGRLAAKQGVAVQSPVPACNIVLVATRSAC